MQYNLAKSLQQVLDIVDDLRRDNVYDSSLLFIKEKNDNYYIKYDNIYLTDELTFTQAQKVYYSAMQY